MIEIITKKQEMDILECLENSIELINLHFYNFTYPEDLDLMDVLEDYARWLGNVDLTDYDFKTDEGIKRIVKEFNSIETAFIED